MRFDLAVCAFRYFDVTLAAQRDPNGYPLVRFRSPSGFHPKVPPTAPSANGMMSTSLGLRRPSAHEFRGSPQPRGFPSPGYVPRPAFLRSARLPPPPASRVYFTPGTLLGFTLQGLIPPTSGARASTRSLPSWRYAERGASIPPLRRLQGLTTAWSPCRSGEAVSSPLRPIPSWVSASLGSTHPS